MILILSRSTSVIEDQAISQPFPNLVLLTTEQACWKAFEPMEGDEKFPIFPRKNRRTLEGAAAMESNRATNLHRAEQQRALDVSADEIQDEELLTERRQKLRKVTKILFPHYFQHEHLHGLIRKHRKACMQITGRIDKLGNIKSAKNCTSKKRQRSDPLDTAMQAIGQSSPRLARSKVCTSSLLRTVPTRKRLKKHIERIETKFYLPR